MEKIVKFLLFVFLSAIPLISYSQINFSANDQVPAYTSGFRFGTNLGGQKGEWKDLELATIAAGSTEKGVPGAGCNSLRLALPNHFLERWGYKIRTNEFNAYVKELGMSELTVFLEGPSDKNIDTKIYCPGKGSSKMFKNLYEPIWDNGKNGTPVNENNPFALYVYETVKEYGKNLRFWEIWNEPDYTTTDKGWQEPNAPDSWWKRDPAPCEMTNLMAPLQHYIRALRIAYEVIKFVNPDDYICIGGIGYESFLDAVLRNTDNPDGGKVTKEYPLTGGAYFDCLSYHSYPMHGTREYKNGKWMPLRHSDKAVEVFIDGKNKKEEVLAKHGYNGTKYPKKRVIVTETNVASKSFNDFIGSEAAQYNYLAKIIVKGQSEGIDQIHTYNLMDAKVPSRSHEAMGFYPWLGETKPYKQTEKKSAVASRNAMQMLKGYKFAKARTKGMNLPNNIDGAAFVKDGKYIYALWAKTKTDNSENVSASYIFPESWEISGFVQYEWDYTLTGKSKSVKGNTVKLTASPSFLVMDNEVVLGFEEKEKAKGILIYPNPSQGAFTIAFEGEISQESIVQVFDPQGRNIHATTIKENAKEYEVQLVLAAGLYIIKIINDNQSFSQKLIVE